ncbi:unnamed protein product [Adineta ricciae]|nr:unnamed protein product [Adineta ricciae]
MTEWMLKFVCPITNEIMTDPVTDPAGNSYERSAIENWLKQHSISPITKAPLNYSDLQPNPTLLASIEEYRQQLSSENSLHMNIASKLTITSTWADGYAHISIRPPEGAGVRAPCDICCVVDISGSMSCAVEIQGANNKEKCGLSQLDLVKHAITTIIHSLTAEDRLALVTFDSKAQVVFSLREMNDQGRAESIKQVEQLQTAGATNLWDGLATGLTVLTKGQRASGSNAALFLLTDGEPTDNPKEGYLPALAALKEKINFTGSVNTFGFGYRLNSKLLEELADNGNTGSYAFIPDASFVGTIFVNAISNLLTTAATNLRLTVSNVDPTIDQTSTYMCHYKIELVDRKSTGSNSLRFQLGSSIFGQSRDVVIPMSEDQYKNIAILLDYESSHGTKNKQCDSFTQLPQDLKSLNQQKDRLEFVYFIRQGYKSLREDRNAFSANQSTVVKTLEELEDRIRNHATDDKYTADLLTDLTGQVKEAFSRQDWFNKWGVHYLPSITRAHLLQQCNNFKDPGVQHYGQGELFSSVRDEMDEMFCSLPAPQPSSGTISPSATPINMSTFNDADNPCFHGSCTVQLFDGSIKLVKHLQRGDRLHPHGASINYVLRTICHNAQAQFILFDGGLMITPWHPVRLDGVHWTFPYSLPSSELTTMPCEAVYSFVLSGEGHTIWVNDVECVTLGHGLQDDIVRHNYYGSERVIEDLRKLDGEQKCDGMVEIESKWIMRNKRTGLVNGIRRPQTNIMNIVQ